MSMIASIRKILRVLATQVSMFKEVGRRKMDVGSFISTKGMLSISCSKPRVPYLQVWRL